jgi:hypothetical protein
LKNMASWFGESREIVEKGEKGKGEEERKTRGRLEDR